MSRKIVWIVTIAAVGMVAAVGSAAAQYRGYSYDAGPNYFEPSPAYDPFGSERRGYAPEREPDRGGADAYYPDDRRGSAAYGRGYDQGYGQAEPYYTDPADGGRGGGRYDLGENANERTMTEVPNPTHQPAGTLVIDTASRHLYLVEKDGHALQYGIGVGREGFAWHGTAQVRRKAEWPGWTPPAEMLKRRPDLPLHMEGGIDNPLGARALYLFNGKGDTGYRIHGTNEPDTIGKAVSSGCIRMMNADVIDLYKRVPVGTRVVVL